MIELELFSLITLYVLLILFGLFTLILSWFQFNVFRGKAMDNPDGSVDDWHEQKILYGMSFADFVIIIPISIISFILILVNSLWGYYLLGLVSFWYIWVNTAFTITSLRFEKPKITFSWIIAYPFGTVLGLGYFIWLISHLEIMLS
ncbi:MAG: hypothetical protein ACW981_09405 [Candidatus Hodarchaeales archaeon]|jgi:hypothetical protein